MLSYEHYKRVMVDESVPLINHAMKLTPSSGVILLHTF